MTRLVATAVLLLGFTVACPGCSRKPPTIDAVFLIVVDTLRPDRLSCYGYDGHVTAATDRLAASGVRFENAQSPASWTLPAMGAMLTSRYPTQLGLVESPPAEPRVFAWREKRTQVAYTLPDGFPTLASLLDDAGFHPVAFVNQPFINAGDGFLSGFAEWCYTAGEDSIVWHDPRTPMPELSYPPGTDLAQADTLLVAEFARWLGVNSDRRPLIWMHLLRPHWPYTPLLHYLPDSVRGGEVPAATAYGAEVREADDLVRDILAAIDARVGLERSLVILVSDHGEELGERGMGEHGHSLHREVVQVPLILAGPSLPRGTTVRGHVSTLDLLPTVLDLVGAAAPGGLEGRSLLPAIRKDKVSRAIYMEGMLYGSTKRALHQDGYKLLFDVQARPAYALYDLVADPLESRNLIDAQPARAAALRQQLLAHGARVIDDYASLVGRGDAAGSSETQRILRAMRTLGYVNE